MKSAIPLKYAQQADNLNRFDHGFLVVSEDDICIHEWYNNRHNQPGGNSFQLCYYVHSLDAHYVINTINNEPLRVFHNFEEVVSWAITMLNPDPPAKIPKYRLPAHKRKDSQKHYYELLGLRNPRQDHTPL